MTAGFPDCCNLPPDPPRFRPFGLWNAQEICASMVDGWRWKMCVAGGLVFSLGGDDGVHQSLMMIWWWVTSLLGGVVFCFKSSRKLGEEFPFWLSIFFSDGWGLNTKKCTLISNKHKLWELPESSLTWAIPAHFFRYPHAPPTIKLPHLSTINRSHRMRSKEPWKMPWTWMMALKVHLGRQNHTENGGGPLGWCP